MFHGLRMPTYTELIGLSDSELIRRVNLLSITLKQAEQQGKNVAEQTKVYMAYKNELTKRINEQSN